MKQNTFFAHMKAERIHYQCTHTVRDVEVLQAEGNGTIWK